MCPTHRVINGVVQAFPRSLRIVDSPEPRSPRMMEGHDDLVDDLA